MVQPPPSAVYDHRQDTIRRLKTPAIETFRNIYSDKRFVIQLSFPEFTAVCPKTGLPDFGTVLIEYIPHKTCLELKSLKEYFFFYRNIGIFHENVVNKITDDLIASCKPRSLTVTVIYNVRGGITTTVKRHYTAKQSTKE